jgi:hypothetical protein
MKFPTASTCELPREYQILLKWVNSFTFLREEQRMRHESDAEANQHGLGSEEIVQTGCCGRTPRE